MSPKRADGAVRTAFIETAAQLIATEGSSGLTLRRVADQVGTSTMAVYTHFGGMNELRLEVRREGFARLAAHLAQVEQTSPFSFTMHSIVVHPNDRRFELALAKDGKTAPRCEFTSFTLDELLGAEGANR